MYTNLLILLNLVILMMQGNLGNWKYIPKRAMEIEFPLKICRPI